MDIVYMHLEVLAWRYDISCDRHGVTGKRHRVTESNLIDFRYHYDDDISSIFIFVIDLTYPLLKAMKISAVGVFLT